jgi:hypothetical protein
LTIATESTWTSPTTLPTAAATQQGAGSGLGGWLRLAGEALRLPFRVLGLGLELMAQTGQQSRRLVGGGVEDAVSQGYSPAGSAAATDLWAVRSNLAPPSPSTPSTPSSAIRPNAGQAPPAAAGAPADTLAITTDQGKETPMSCDADHLSGCDLKVISYWIINANPYIDDCEEFEEGTTDSRILFGPKTISTTQNLSEADFTAWVIALNIQEDPEKVKHCDKQYLRVCWALVCRVPLPMANYPKKELEVAQSQVRILREIREELGGPKKAEYRSGEASSLVRDDSGKKNK